MARDTIGPEAARNEHQLQQRVRRVRAPSTSLAGAPVNAQVTPGFLLAAGASYSAINTTARGAVSRRRVERLAATQHQVLRPLQSTIGGLGSRLYRHLASQRTVHLTTLTPQPTRTELGDGDGRPNGD